MRIKPSQVLLVNVTVLSMALVACAPATPPSPTAAPKPTEAPKPAAPAAKPTDAPAAKPAEAKPAASPAAKPAEAKPAASPAAKPAEAKPAASPAAKPAAKFDEKAVADFYRGKTATLTVGFPAGAGTDNNARIVARHMGKYIPGNPNIIVQNQPGAGGMIAVNQVYRTAAKDGTAMVHFLGGSIFQQLVGNPAVEFDAKQYQYLGSMGDDNTMCVVTTASGFNSLGEARGNRELVFGGTGPGATTNDVPSILKGVLGLNVKLVSGYAGLALASQAARQGEIHGVCSTWGSLEQLLQQDIAGGGMKVIAQSGETPHPKWPNVPFMAPLANTDEQRQLLKVGIDFNAKFLYPFAVPPGVPADRVEALRAAFQQTLRDREMLAEAERINVYVRPMSAEDFQKGMAEMFSISPDLLAKLKAALAA